MTRPGFAFSTLFKVRYAEIDAQRVVYNSRYLEYADAAVSDFWPSTGIETTLGDVWTDLEFHVRHTSIDYRKPFVLGDTVEVFMKIARVGTSSLTQAFDLCHAASGELHAAIEMVIVNVDLATGKPEAIPEAARAYLATLTG